MSVSKPKLQIALDSLSYEDAFRSLSNGLDDIVDIIEVGTFLLLAEGLRAVDIMRTIYPEKILVADFKCIAPHFGFEILKHKPNFTTVLSCAEEHVKKLIFEKTMERGEGQEVQVELYGDDWTWDNIQDWKDMGIKHIIYSRPRSRKGSWGAEDAADVKKLCDMDMLVTATGGMSYEGLDAIKGLPIFAIICGRSVRNAENPAAEAKRIKERIQELWK